MFLALLQLWSLTSVFRHYHYPLYIKLDRIQSFNQKKVKFVSTVFLAYFHSFFCATMGLHIIIQNL